MIMMTALIDRVRRRLEQQETACALEEVMDLCPELTWNQVFLAIDYLSRAGQVRVTMDMGKSYTVQACRPVAAVTSNAHNDRVGGAGTPQNSSAL